jgi:primosomal protein N' (replication factor Y)
MNRQTALYNDAMYYYEVWVADGRYHGDAPLTYHSETELTPLSVVSIPLRSNISTGFVARQVPKPKFAVKPIKAILSSQPLPAHCFELARWLSEYYCAGFGDALRQFAPSIPSAKRKPSPEAKMTQIQEDLRLDFKLTNEQVSAIAQAEQNKSTTVLLHGDTGSGKTRVYLELAQKQIDEGKSVIILTPEIGLTAQLIKSVTAKLNCPIHLLHSEMTPAQRKRTWFEILESEEPLVVVGPRSALFAPIAKLGLIVVDEAHEAAYKQEQKPHYHAVRVASRLGELTGSKVILGSATPSVTDYYLAKKHDALIRMKLQAGSGRAADIEISIVDLRDKNNISKNRHLSDKLVAEVNHALAAHKQSLLYYNRRGTARLILCSNCGWQQLCPNCDIPLVYHGDDHQARCHTCGYKQAPPNSCPVCSNNDIIYTSLGTKALADLTSSTFSSARVSRFDSDNQKGEKLNELYELVRSGQTDILVGTQLIAKGLDLPKLSVVGIVAAETSLAIPDFTAEERTFQLLYQVIGRVGRHSAGKIIIQTYDPASFVIAAAAKRDYETFYEKIIEERKAFRFPPYSYLMKLVARRATLNGASLAAQKLKEVLISKKLPIEVIGPTPSFQARRGRNYYYQLVVRAKSRQDLTKLAESVPAGWSIDLDPVDLL